MTKRTTPPIKPILHIGQNLRQKCMWIPSPHQIPQILSEPMTDCNQNFEYNFSNFGVEAEMKISPEKS